MKKFLLRFFLSVFLLVLLLAGSLTLAVYFFQDKIIAAFIAQANKRLVTKVDVGNIEVTIWQSFPQASLAFSDVVIHSSIAGDEVPLASIGKLYLSFDVLKLWKGEYRLNQITAENGKVRLRIASNGEVNYKVFKPSTDSAAARSTGKFKLDLDKVGLTNIDFAYANDSTSQQYAFTSKFITGIFSVNGAVTSIGLAGKGVVQQISFGGGAYFANKAVSINAGLAYDDGSKHLSIGTGSVGIGQAQFNVSGSIQAGAKPYLDLKATGQNTSIQHIISFLPQKLTASFAAYKSEGNVYFTATAKGTTAKGATPAINIDFGCSNASFYHPGLNKRLTNAGFTGSYSNGKTSNLTGSVLAINNLKASLMGKPLEASFTISNFKQPYIKGNLLAQLNLADALGFYPVTEISRPAGSFEIALEAAGSLADFSNPNPRMKAAGEVTLSGIGFTAAGYGYPVSQLNGVLLFNNSDVVLSNLEGRAGSSDFAINAKFHNLVNNLLRKDNHLKLEARLESNYINLEELLATNARKEGQHSTGITLPQNVELLLHCRVNSVSYGKFKPQKLAGSLLLKPQGVRLSDVAFQLAGGNVSGWLQLDYRNPQHAAVDLQGSLDGVEADSVFHIFDNFSQNYLPGRNIKGNLDARVTASFQMNNRLEIDMPSINAAVDARITNGELNNFEPMQALARFTDQTTLNNLRFEELKNTFKIADSKITIPEMEVKSNLIQLYVSGTHGFNQDMDYRLRIPLKNFKKADKDARFGEVADDGTGTGNLHLLLTGRQGNIKISIDKQATTSTLKERLAKEKRELLNLFKRKPRELPENQGTPNTTPAADKPAEKPKPKEAEQEFFDF